jgi:hypothetical protein
MSHHFKFEPKMVYWNLESSGVVLKNTSQERLCEIEAWYPHHHRASCTVRTWICKYICLIFVITSYINIACTSSIWFLWPNILIRGYNLHVYIYVQYCWTYSYTLSLHYYRLMERILIKDIIMIKLVLILLYLKFYFNFFFENENKS